MYYIELYNRTTRTQQNSATAKTEEGAAKTAAKFIETAKTTGKILNVSNYDISPRGFVCGQRIETTAGIFEVSTARA